MGLIGFSLHFLYRQTPKRIWLFVFLLVGLPFLILAIPDLLWSGQRSTRIRYLFPSILGIQLALAYLFAMQAVWVKTWPQKLWRFLLIFCWLLDWRAVLSMPKPLFPGIKVSPEAATICQLPPSSIRAKIRW